MKLRCGFTSSSKSRKINASISWYCSGAKAAWSGSKTNPPWAVHLFKPPALPEVADKFLMESRKCSWMTIPEACATNFALLS